MSNNKTTTPANPHNQRVRVNINIVLKFEAAEEQVARWAQSAKRCDMTLNDWIVTKLDT